MPLITANDEAAALGFLIRQTSHIEQAVNKADYPEIQYSLIVPVDGTAHPFAKTVTYFSSDSFGRADWVNGNGDTMPQAGSELTKHEQDVHTAGIGYGYGYEEINQAQFLGYNLRSEDAFAARLASEQFVDRVALVGDEKKGFKGLTNHPSVPTMAAMYGNWDAATDKQIISDVDKAIYAPSKQTNNVSMANTLLLPPIKLRTLSSRVIDGTTMTLLEFIRKSNVVTSQTGVDLTIKGVRGLDKAGVGGTSRMISYRRHPDVLKLHYPMPHQFLEPRQSGVLSFAVPGIFRVGGLDIRRPLEVSYFDGI